MTRLDDGATRLRSGRSVWQANEPSQDRKVTAPPREPVAMDTEIAIVGAGITGAFLAERFTRAGRRVVVIDRHAPAAGSTAASTAMLLWELDASLIELEDRMGMEAAARIVTQCRQQVVKIGALVNQLGIDCDFRPRPSLYLAGDKLDAADLREERKIRTHAGIEGAYLEPDALFAHGFVGEGALLYDGSAEADPVKLARGLMAVAMARGARVISPATATRYETMIDGVVVETREGDVVRAATLVLASGYEMPDFVPAARHTLLSSWAIATRPVPQPFPASHALAWEAADPYLYMRSTADGRVVIGGEDEEFADAHKRERMTPEKVAALLAKAAMRCPSLAGLEADFAWSGVFGETDDATPMIGRVPGRPNCLAAFGYGGNGITFSALAADLLEAELQGGGRGEAEPYALDRN